MPNLLLLARLIAASTLALSSISHADQLNTSTPESTQQVLRHILQISNLNLPAKSSCRDFPESKQGYKLADWMSMQLSYLQSGQNSIQGQCTATDCELVIKHQDGESVFTSYLRFKLRGKQADPSSLTCLTIP